MDSRKLQKVGDELESLRGRSGNLKARDIIAVAKKLGRREGAKKGSHVAYVSDLLPNRRPVTIPVHAKPSNINRFTAEGILDELEQDYEELMVLSKSE